MLNALLSFASLATEYATLEVRMSLNEQYEVQFGFLSLFKTSQF